MFGRKTPVKNLVSADETDGRKIKTMSTQKTVDTVIGKNTELTGTIKSSGTVRVDGKFDGDIDTSSDLVIGEGGFVRAKVKAQNVIIAGNMEGDLEAKSRLEIVPTGSLQGNAKTGVLVIEEGAIFKGQVEMATGNNPVTQTLTPKREVVQVTAKGTTTVK